MLADIKQFNLNLLQFNYRALKTMNSLNGLRTQSVKLYELVENANKKVGAQLKVIDHTLKQKEKSATDRWAERNEMM